VHFPSRESSSDYVSPRHPLGAAVLLYSHILIVLSIDAEKRRARATQSALMYDVWPFNTF
jgi:hypothetical protein